MSQLSHATVGLQAGRLLDLSQEIYEGMPVYRGHLKTAVWDFHTHAETSEWFDDGFSYASRGLVLSDHGPTHVDAISHLDPAPDAPAIDQMSLDRFCGPGTCVDVSFAEPHSYITAEHLSAAVTEGGDLLRPGDVLLIRTGSYERFGGTPKYASQYPGLDATAADWIIERQVKVFGVDMPSPDNPTSRVYPIHMMCREHGLTHYENLANLKEVVGRRFTFFGFPLRIRGGTGSPVRAVALLDE
jgi:kynurenine formamidase